MTINNRIRTYDENVKPILEHYKKQGLLRIVDGNKTIHFKKMKHKLVNMLKECICEGESKEDDNND